MNIRFIIAALILWIALPACADNRTAAEALMARARNASNFEEDGSKPFVIKARFHALHMTSGEMEGTYTYYWKSKDEWRVDARLGEYRELAIQSGKRHWYAANQRFAPAYIQYLSFALAAFQHPSINRAKFGKLSQTPADGLTCFEAKSKYDKKKLCFAKEGTLVSYEETEPGDWGGSGTSHYEFFDFVRFGSKLYPKSIQMAEGKRILLNATIESVEDWSPTPADFEPEPGSELTETCETTVTPPKVRFSPDPKYPENKHGVGPVRVILFVRVSKEGQVIAAQVQRSAGQDFDREALAAVRQWKFDPSRCAGEPVPVNINIEINFSPQ